MNYLYFIQAGKDGPIKIGITNDIEKRLKSLQTANSKKLEVLYYTKTSSPRKSEKLLHDHFRENNINGEWFRPDKYLLDHIEKLKSVNYDSLEESATWFNLISIHYQGIIEQAQKLREDGCYIGVKHLAFELMELARELNRGAF